MYLFNIFIINKGRRQHSNRDPFYKLLGCESDMTSQAVLAISEVINRAFDTCGAAVAPII